MDLMLLFLNFMAPIQRLTSGTTPCQRTLVRVANERESPRGLHERSHLVEGARPLPCGPEGGANDAICTFRYSNEDQNADRSVVDRLEIGVLV